MKIGSWTRIALTSPVDFDLDFSFNNDFRMQDQNVRWAFPMSHVKYLSIFCDVVSLFTKVLLFHLI